ncbi:MAG TPA: glycosyltransferase family 39 protein [Planctomycetota bacterium]|nr:glycosyltransferase family 39 protein [Planctomycetota bacterium]
MSDPVRPPAGPPEARLVALLFLTAALVRLVSWMGLAMFGPDGSVYLTMADLMREGRFQEALSMAYHPLYPLLVAATGMATSGSVLAGHLVSILLGASAVVPLFKIAQEFFGRPAAFVTGLFYSFHSPLVEVQTDVMTDATFLFFFLSAVWLTWRLSVDPTLEGAVTLGITAAAAFLTRPEGLLSIALAVGWPLLCLAWRRAAALRSLGSIALAAGVVLLLIMPYLFWVKADRGHWAFSVRPSALSAERSAGITDERTRRIYADSKPDPQLYRRYGASLLRLNLYGLLFPFHLLGLARFRHADRARQAFYALCVIGYMGGVAWTLRKHNAMSDRYLMPAMVLLSALAGLGIVRAARLLGERIATEAWRPAAGGALIAALTVAPGLLFLGTRNQQQVSFPIAASWIRSQGGENRPISSTVPQVNYLAGRRFLPLPNTREEVRRQIVEERAQFFLYSERDVRSRTPDVRMLVACEWLEAPIEAAGPPGTEKLFLQRVK